MKTRAGVLSLSPTFRFALPISALITYFLGLLLYQELGDTTPILSVLPVVAAGRALGSRAGLCTALFTAPLNTLILNRTGHSGWDALLAHPEGIAGMAALVFMGVAVGRLMGLKGDVVAARWERDRLHDQNRQISQAKAELVERLSQDLRTPLHTMAGFLELLRSGKVTDSTQHGEFVLRAALDAERIATIVDDLFDFTCAEDGHLSLNLQKVDLSRVIDETTQSLQILAASKGIALTYVRPKLSMIVEGDRHRLRRVVFNLLERAINVSPPDRRVVVVGQRSEKGVTIQVIDQGGGMTPKACSSVFDRDGYVRGSAKGRLPSTIMALHVAKLIVEAHGGQMGVRSTIGAGSDFHFFIPTSAEDTSEIQAES